MVALGSSAGERTRADNTAKVARRRGNAKAEQDLHNKVKPEYADHLIPTRQLDVDPERMRYIGQLIAGVQDFKVLRGSVAVISLSTSTQFAHLLTDASMIGRGKVLVVDLYVVDRKTAFHDEDDDDAE